MKIRAILEEDFGNYNYMKIGDVVSYYIKNTSFVLPFCFQANK